MKKYQKQFRVNHDDINPKTAAQFLKSKHLLESGIVIKSNTRIVESGFF